MALREAMVSLERLLTRDILEINEKNEVMAKAEKPLPCNFFDR